MTGQVRSGWRVRGSISAFDVGVVLVQRMRYGQGVRFGLSKRCRGCRHGEDGAMPVRGFIRRAVSACSWPLRRRVPVLFVPPTGHLTRVGGAGEATRRLCGASEWLLGRRGTASLLRLWAGDAAGVERSPLQEGSADDEPSWLSHELLPPSWPATRLVGWWLVSAAARLDCGVVCQVGWLT